MPSFTFETPPELPPGPSAAAWLCGGQDHWPVPSRVASRSPLRFERKEQESVTLAFGYPLPTGLRVVGTSTLRPDAPPYHLATELARGAANQMRNFVAAIASAGLSLPEEATTAVRTATAAFGAAVAERESSTRERAAAAAVAAAVAATDAVADALADYRLAARRESHGRLPVQLAGVLREPLTPTEADAFAATVNAVRIVPEWHRIEAAESAFNWSRLDPLVVWANAQDLPITVGPLLDFPGRAFPAWLREAPADVPTLAAFMADFVGTVVNRYRGKVRSWELFAGLNGPDAFGLSEDDRLRLAARLLEAAKELDPGAAWSYRVHDPSGEYLRDERQTYSPLLFVDTLARSGYEFAGIALDLPSSAPRGPLEFLQLLDSYDSLVPSVRATVGHASVGLAKGILRTALGSPSVAGVEWTNWSDKQLPAGPAETRLFDTAAEAPTPLAAELASFRQRWLT